MTGTGDPILSVTDWGVALQAGWEVRGADGTWAVEAGQLHLHVNQGGASGGLEVCSTQPFTPAEAFALEIDLRFDAIGLADNDTENDTKLILEFGGGPDQSGFQVQLAGDRYKLDVDRSDLQYLIFRSEPEEWYRWRFEISGQQLAMLRNGTYYSLHKLHGPRSAGLRVHVYGAPALPARVQIGAVRIEPLPARPADAPAAPTLVDAVQPDEWPMYRRDRRNSAHSPLIGAWGTTPPQVAWSYPLGGWNGDILSRDVDGDGAQEVLILYDGNVSLFRVDGTRLWQRNIDSPRLYEICDLDEDSRQEVILGAESPTHVLVLDAASGQTRYSCALDPEYPVRGLRLGKLDPARRGLQMFVWTQSEIGYCLSFDQGLENGYVLWTYNYVHFNFTPEVVLVDMDLDGLLEVVLATYNSFFVYDGRTGAVKMSLEAPLGRNYGLLIVQDIDGDGYPDIIMLAEQLREHITVVHNEGGRSLRLLYDKFYEQNYPRDLRELRTLPGSVQDWDGDGQVEILYGLYDETDGDLWQTLLINAVTGEVKLTLDNYYPVTLDWLPRGEPVVFLAETRGRGRRQLKLHGDMSSMEMALDGAVHVFQFSGDTAYHRATVPSGELLLEYSSRGFPLNEWAIFMQLRRPLRLAAERGVHIIQPASDSGTHRIIRHYHLDAGGALQAGQSCALPDTLPDGHVMTFCAHPRQPAGGAFALLYAGADTTLYLLDQHGQTLTTFPGGSLPASPVVASLAADAPPRLLVCAASGSMLCLDASDHRQRPKLQWQVPSVWRGHSLYSRQGQAVPVAFDWNQDGRKEILLGQPESRLSIFNAEGQRLWMTILPEEPTFWNYGNFTGGRQFDVFTAYASSAYGGGCGVYTPGQPEPVWQAGNGAYSTAIADFDGDGRDDILTRDLFWRRTLDGATGQDVFPITQWAGYHTPTLVTGADAPEDIGVAWTAGGYSLTVDQRDGTQRWWKPFMGGWRPGAVADVDGDGRLEIGAPTWGKVFTWPPPMAPVEGLGRVLACLDLASGEVRWTYDPGAAMSGVISADVDGDGRPEFIFGTGDGRLLALRGGPDEQRRVVFSVQLPAALSTPVLCDPTGAGRPHLLIGCADGNLYALT